MINICICDDNLIHCTQLENYIIKYMRDILKMKVKIEIYGRGETLLKAIIDRKETYQILFLDIEMDKLNGIETAQQIRKMDRSLIIIYVTSYDKYTMESFEVSPFRYLLKPVDCEQIYTVLSQAIDEVMLNNQYLFFKYQNNQYQIKSESIISITSVQGRMILVTTVNNEEPFCFYGKIKDMEENMNPLIFVKVNQGIIINMNYIHIISGSDIHMVNKEVFPISRGQKKKVKSSYNEYLRRKIGL